MLALFVYFVVFFDCKTFCGLLSQPRRAKIVEKIHYITFFFHGTTASKWTKTSSLSRIHDHTQLDTPHPVRLLWTNDQHFTETSTWQHTTPTKGKKIMPPAGFKPAIPASERPQIHALDHAATWIGALKMIMNFKRPQNIIHFCRVGTTGFDETKTVLIIKLNIIIIIIIIIIMWKTHRLYVDLHSVHKPYVGTVELHLSGSWLSGPPIIRIGSAPPVNFSRILRN